MRSALTLLSTLLLMGCSNNNQTDQSKSIAIFNQAYQENFQPDTLETILSKAINAYVLIDPFDLEENLTQKIPTIKAKGNQLAGYISVGTGETWRTDFQALQPYLATQEWAEWEGEYYVSETTTGILEIMQQRIDRLAQWGFDWVEFDNMDWFTPETKTTYNLQLTQEDAKEYIHTLCAYTHAKGMKCMAKNTVEGFDEFDGVLYESSHQNQNWWDHEGMRQFLEAGKLVIINHYNESDCDAIYDSYKAYYQHEGISFICEDTQLQAYRHYNLDTE